MKRVTGVVLILLLATLAGVAPAGADTHCVKPGGAGGCQATVQAAVTAASPGDIVLVYPGVYNENVVVWGGLDGLQLVGVNKATTIIDADYPLEGWGIETLSQPRPGAQPDGPQRDRPRAVPHRQRHPRPGAADRRQHGHLRGLRRLGTSGHRILNNEIRGTAGRGIEFVGTVTNSIVSGNLITQAASDGIFANGDNNQILNNRLVGIGARGIVASGRGLAVRGNLVQRAGTTGIYVDGDELDVRANTLASAGPLLVTCTACSSATVAANTTVGSVSVGILASADAPGLGVSGNKVSGAFDRAFQLGGTGIEASLNTATDTGVGATGDCFDLVGQGIALSRSTATRCGGSGFRVLGDDNTLDLNTATAASVSGFLVDGNGGANANAVLTHNRAAGNGAQGFAVIGGAVNTVLTGNTALNHRTDLCDQGTGTNTSGGNTFGTPGGSCSVLD